MPVLIHQTDAGYARASGDPYGRCYVCGRPVKPPVRVLLIDRDTQEALDPADESSGDRGRFWAIGPDCLRKHPGADRLLLGLVQTPGR